MKKKNQFTGITSILLFLIVCVVCNNNVNKSTLPRITSLDRYTATITWETEHALQGVLIYYQEGKKQKKVAEEKPVKNHRITIAGLLPDNQQ